MQTNKFKRKEARMTPDEQLNLWVEGVSVHNTARDECTPDFSCCTPELLASKSVRLKFLRGDTKVRNAILFDFLGKMIQKKTKRKVLIVR